MKICAKIIDNCRDCQFNMTRSVIGGTDYYCNYDPGNQILVKNPRKIPKFCPLQDAKIKKQKD